MQSSLALPDLLLTRLVLEVPRGRAYPEVPGVQVFLVVQADQVYRGGLGFLLVLLGITRSWLSVSLMSRCTSEVGGVVGEFSDETLRLCLETLSS